MKRHIYINKTTSTRTQSEDSGDRVRGGEGDDSTGKYK